MNRKILFSLILFLILNLNLILIKECEAKNPIISYEPSTVILKGILDKQTFPGPPNYESIKNGDDIETHFYLKLNRAVDVIPFGLVTDGEAVPEKNVKIMQLTIGGDDDILWNKIRKIGKGGKAIAIGTIFHRFTGHHHTRVILIVKKIVREKIEKKIIKLSHMEISDLDHRHWKRKVIFRR